MDASISVDRHGAAACHGGFDRREWRRLLLDPLLDKARPIGIEELVQAIDLLHEPR